MDLAFVPISYILCNGITIDDLAVLLAVLAVILLMTGVVPRAAVSGPLFSSCYLSLIGISSVYLPFC
jgi:hypothetical protein